MTERGQLTRSALLCLLTAACGPSAEQVRLQSERAELRSELNEVRQYNADLKFRMKLVEARNRVLIDLVQGLSQDPEHFKLQRDTGASSADASLQALDRDVEALISSVRHSHTDLDALRAQRAALQAELAQARRTIEEARATHAELDARISGLRRLLNPMLGLIHAGRINLSMAYGQVAIQLPEAVLFASGEPRLTAEGKALLAQVAEGLKTSGDRQFRISGPPELVVKRNANSGQRQLSAARALAVLDYLLQCNVPPPNLLASTHASAQTSPTLSASTERYIEIALVPKFEERPILPTTEQLLQPLEPSADTSSDRSTLIPASPSLPAAAPPTSDER